QVGAQRHLAVIGAGAVGQRRADLDALPLTDQRALVRAGALVRATELRQAVRGVRALVLHDLDGVRRDLLDDAGLLGDGDVTGVDGGAVLHAGADERGVVADQRDGLTLHV